MPNSENAETKYIGAKYGWIFRKFTLDELHILLSKGAQLFAEMDLTNTAEQYLHFNPDLDQVIKKW